MEKENRAKFKIVVVDDSDFARRTIVSILEAEGFQVVGQGKNAEEAIKLAITTACDLMVLDVVMPELSGIEVAKYLMDKKIKTAILMMSSLTTDAIIMESIRNGAWDFLKKPFRKEDLVAAVEKIADLLKSENTMG